jgi:hypothetical protein
MIFYKVACASFKDTFFMPTHSLMTWCHWLHVGKPLTTHGQNVILQKVSQIARAQNNHRRQFCNKGVNI